MSPKVLESVRAEALFVSDLQCSEAVNAQGIRTAVMGAVRRHGPRGVAALVAEEFGEHPDTAVNRMSWVLGVVRTAYPH